MRKTLLTIGLATLLAGCTNKKCDVDQDCDDGLFCNGAEACVLGYCTKPGPPSCDDGLACTVDRCSEDLRRCVHNAPDKDGDGHGDMACVDQTGTPLGDDCDDNDVNRFPGNRETCDTHDEDCNPDTVGTRDEDGDGFISSACSNPLPDGGIHRGLDCDDSNQGIHPGQLEVCNGVDDNCNGQVDEGVRVTRYTDADHDGWGTGAGMLGCLTDPGTSDVAGDCDDTNPAMHPGQFKCVVGGQQNQYSLCATDGGFTGGLCPSPSTACRPQPNGTGICL